MATPYQVLHLVPEIARGNGNVLIRRDLHLAALCLHLHLAFGRNQLQRDLVSDTRHKQADVLADVV